ncbi:MAG: hypothetical protein ACPGJV_07950 [Bacteriovoracaceae bacterium]
MFGPFLKLIALVTLFSVFTAEALPINWKGTFGADTTLINNYRRIKEATQQTDYTSNFGTQEIPTDDGNGSSASFQSYVLRLNPEIIVNDSASFFGELTTGYGRGGLFGDSSVRRGTQNGQNSYGNALYYHNTTDSSDDLQLGQFYLDLYADTATYRIGRFSSHWGLGAVVHSGEGAWDRHAFVRDGIELQFKIGNFEIKPFYAKISSTDGLTRPTRVKEVGVSLLYENDVKEVSFGIYYAHKKDGSDATSATVTDVDGTGTDYSIGQTSVKLTDLFVKKRWGDFALALEVPLYSGQIGDVYNIYSEANSSKYKAKAFILESEYRLSPSLLFQLNAGKVSGDSGNTNVFEAMYLNPNYQIAHLLFRYNLYAISDPNAENLYDSYVHNASYIKALARYTSGNWDWDVAVIKAVAEEVAKKNSTAFNHSTNRLIDSAVANQDDDLGLEIDLGVNYRWNKEINVHGGFGYLFTGEYYSFSNEANRANSADNTMLFQLGTSIQF